MLPPEVLVRLLLAVVLVELDLTTDGEARCTGRVGTLLGDGTVEALGHPREQVVEGSGGGAGVDAGHHRDDDVGLVLALVPLDRVDLRDRAGDVDHPTEGQIVDTELGLDELLTRLSLRLPEGGDGDLSEVLTGVKLHGFSILLMGKVDNTMDEPCSHSTP